MEAEQIPTPADEKLPVQLHQAVIPPASHTGHQWRQRGHVVHCDGSADHDQHGFNINHNQMLTGHDANGYPVISTISVMQAVEIDPSDATA